jgi:hypothetical protein
MIKLTFIILISAHIIGCAFFLIGSELSRHGHKENWVDNAGLTPECIQDNDHASSDHLNSWKDCNFDGNLISKQYIASLYWSIYTLTTVGYGDIVAVAESERVFNIFVFVCGVVVYASVIAYIQEIVSQLDVTTGGSHRQHFY